MPDIFSEFLYCVAFRLRTGSQKCEPHAVEFSWAVYVQIGFCQAPDGLRDNVCRQFPFVDDCFFSSSLLFQLPFFGGVPGYQKPLEVFRFQGDYCRQLHDISAAQFCSVFCFGLVPDIWCFNGL